MAATDPPVSWESSERGVLLRPYPPPAHRPQFRMGRARNGRPIHPATLFRPQDPDLSPELHFPLQTVYAPGRTPFPRFVNRFDSREMLLVVDGSCVNNGRTIDGVPSAACSFLFKCQPTAGVVLEEPEVVTLIGRPVASPHVQVKREDDDQGAVAAQTQALSGKVAFRLETCGPAGQPLEHTSNRAKLRAVIAALDFRPWPAEGWRRVVILTDLEYVVGGATRLLPRWIQRQWRKGSRGARGPQPNRDLWEALQSRVEALRARGCEVSFWLVRRGDAIHSRFLAEAKDAAREAVRRCPGVQEHVFTQLCGVMV